MLYRRSVFISKMRESISAIKQVRKCVSICFRVDTNTERASSSLLVTLKVSSIPYTKVRVRN